METPTEGDVKSNDELITIAGGVELEVTHLDGTNETVKVRQIPISKVQQLLFALGVANEADCLELYCDKPKGWADTLIGASVNAVADKGQEINLPFFGAWSRRQAKWREAFATNQADEANKPPDKASASASSALQSPTTTT
jgi:hypothetical protein